ncbi:uncharacterized protein [Argopecten irradians]|uniref:uncharacterized protein n=1 Tax=Argopecten irradians TaxID=31199 RepID=UPI00371B56AA
MGDGKRSKRPNTERISTPVRGAGQKRKSEEPQCPVDIKNTKLGDHVDDWLTYIRKTTDKEQIKDQKNLNSTSESPEPADPTESKTYMYVVDDDEPIAKRRKSGRRNRRRRKGSKRTQISGETNELICENNGKLYLTPADSETLHPVVSTLPSAARGNKKSRKTKTRRKRKSGARHKKQDLTSQTINLGLTAKERFREAQMNVLTYSFMNKEISDACAPKVCIGQKRKFHEMDYDIEESQVNNLISKFQQLSI